MKKISLFISMLLSILLTDCSTSRLTKEEMAEREAAVRYALDNRHFTVDVDYMLPSSGSPRFLNAPYSLFVNDEKIVSYLPYFGRAYSIPYGGGKGLNFNSTITEYTMKQDDNGKTLIDLQTATDEDRYYYHIEVFANGNTLITVSSNQRQQISFQGKLKTD
jgi:hypothetical protein